MKFAAIISRIVTCTVVALYTLLACFHVGEEARYKCMKIMPNADGAYELMLDRITPEALLFIVSGVALLALCAVAMIFLFRKGWLSALIAGVSILASAIYGMSLNTMLSEAVLWREIARIFKIYGTDAVYVSIKNVLGLLCILAAVCYFVLYIIYCKKLSNAEENANEQNS